MKRMNGPHFTFRSSSVAALVLAACAIPAASAAIDTKEDWDSAFSAKFKAGDPGFSRIANDSSREEYAWHNHYWIRGYLALAENFGDARYLDKAVALIDHMRENTDRKRYQRGELGLVNYASGPVSLMQVMYCQKNPTASVCSGIPTTGPMAMPNSWRRPYNGVWRIETLTDGMILQPITRFIDLVTSDARFASYRPKAESYLAFADSVVRYHEDVYSFTRDTAVPGSYWYVRPADPFTTGRPTDSRLSSNELPYNHSATMAVSLLLLDKIKGGVPEYRRRADSILAFFRKNVRESDGAWQWNYHLRDARDVEDFFHGHIDISFLVLAKKLGRPGLTDADMRRLAAVVTKKVYAGNGNINGEIDGSGGYSAAYSTGTIAIDWIDLAEWEPSIVPMARAVLEKNLATPVWSRPFCGWANLLAWEKRLSGTTGTGPRNGSDRRARIRARKDAWEIAIAGAQGIEAVLLDLQGRELRRVSAAGEAAALPAQGISQGVHLLRIQAQGPDGGVEVVRVAR